MFVNSWNVKFIFRSEYDDLKTAKWNHNNYHFMFYYWCCSSLSPPLQAQAVTLTVAQAFKVALDLWEIAQEGEFTEQWDGGVGPVQLKVFLPGCLDTIIEKSI